jgi:predicted ATP-grasp superfamily ATP-dependent carboligase
VQERGTTGSSDNAYLGHGRAVSTSNAEVIIRNPVVMRGAPEVTLSGNLVANNGASRIGSSYSVQEPSTHSFQVTGGGMSSLVVNECVRIYLKDDGDTITVDAEL